MTNRNAAYNRSVKYGDSHVIAGTHYRGRNPAYIVTPSGVRKIQNGIPFVKARGVIKK